MRVLDLFSGGGYYAEIAARGVGADGRVTRHNNRAYLSFHDAYWTPKPEDGEWTVTRDPFMTALYRALRPGGRVLVIDHSAVAGSREDRPLRARAREARRVIHLGERSEPGRRHRELLWTLHERRE